MVMRTVAALYIDPRGPYPSMPYVECWDESRDAKLYSGLGPVVAHPPCGPWSKLRHLCTKQDPECGLVAVRQVQALGGVLEHPEYSSLFDYMGLPKPGDATDHHGGRTYLARQVWWGHQCDKPTWLYVVRVDQRRVMRDIAAARRRGGEPTHCICTGPRQLKRLPVASKPMKRRTPPRRVARLPRAHITGVPMNALNSSPIRSFDLVTFIRLGTCTGCSCRAHLVAFADEGGYCADCAAALVVAVRGGCIETTGYEVSP
jgi:hypothetical protein